MVSIGNLQLLENLSLKDNNLNSRTEISFERREETLED